MQGHLQTFVGIFVVHVMDDVHGIDIHAGQPLHHCFKLVEHIVVGEIFTRDRSLLGRYLIAGDLVAAAIDSIEQTLGEVGTRAEELHLLAHQHRRHTTSDRAIIAPGAAHDVVTFEL